MLSPNNGDSTERHQHQHQHHTASAASQTNTDLNGASSHRRISTTGHLQQAANVSVIGGGGVGNPISGRRKSSLSYQQQLQLVNATNGAADVMMGCGNSCSDSSGGGRYSPHPNEIFLHHHHQGKLSIQPIERYDDTLGCCLPPPSPAPNSDRYIVGLVGPTGAAASATGGNCLAGGQHNIHMHVPYGSNYECSGQMQAQLQAQQQLHQQQSMSLASSSSNSSLSANSCNPSCPGSGNVLMGGNNAQLVASASASLNLAHNKLVASAVAPIQRSISPNSRFRMSDRLRDLPLSKSDGSSTSGQSPYASAPPARLVSSAHFLTQSTSPLVSNDTYTYLSSTVHTPVKRYVPTPPPPNELYADSMPMPSSAQMVLNKCNGNSSNVGLHANTPQHMNTLPYRFRLKCCANEQNTVQHHHHHQQQQQQQQQQQHQQMQQTLPTNTSHAPHHLEHRSLSVADYYATSPRTRPSYVNSGNKCNLAPSTTGAMNYGGKESPSIILNDQQQMQMAGTMAKFNNSSGASTTNSCLSTGGSGNSSNSSASLTTSPITVGGGSICKMSGRQTAPTVQRPSTCALSDCASQTPNIEFINSAVATSNGILGRNTITTVALEVSSGNLSNGLGSNSGAATCLHCNTARRTTGVHQTTQTTGPISPIPLSQINTGSHCNSNLQQVTYERTPTVMTPSNNEAHISPLSPSGNIAQARVQHKLEVVEPQQQEYQQKLYVQQQQQQKSQTPPQLLSIAPPSGMNERASGAVVSCQQQQQQMLVQAQQSVQPVSNRQLTLQPQQPQPQQQQQLPMQQRYSRKKRLNQYLRKEVARFFGVEASTEAEECAIWSGRQRRLALRRFGALKSDSELNAELNNTYNAENGIRTNRTGNGNNQNYHHHASERPDILPAQDTEEDELSGGRTRSSTGRRHFHNVDFRQGDHVERKASVATMIMSSLTYVIHTLNKRQPRYYRQWSRSFAPLHVSHINGTDNPSDICDGLTALQEDEVFFDSPGLEQAVQAGSSNGTTISPAGGVASNLRMGGNSNVAKIIEHQRQIYMGERVNGWRTSAIIGTNQQGDSLGAQQQALGGGMPQQMLVQHQHQHQQQQAALHNQQSQHSVVNGTRGNRISAQLLDGVLENSRRPVARHVKLFSVNDLDDRTDHRPFFTYWVNTVQILVLFLSLICYGIGPIGIGMEQKTGQVLVTSLSLQTVQHTEQRNVWIGPRNNDLVHMGAKFATCMRRDVKIMDVLLKTRRQERETACCIRNDDSGCVQSSQADCSVRGLYPTKSISTWKKWSPGESGPGGRISGSVCGLDPKYCDAPASIAPYEWPDDITKWPICRKTNSFSQRFRYKDHTAEHMVCEVIGHPCCTGVYGECRITTREYCDFVNGYFHEEASLCSQISCLNNVCGMFPFFSVEVPDQFYRLFTSLCLHAGVLHLAITVVFQHVFLADLERLIGPIRTAIVYIGSGLAGNLTSAVLVPYKPEVGPLASLSGVVASLVVLLILMHWKQLRKPHVALFKLIFIGALLFGIGTLPWQLNFAGLLAGIICGIFLTIALVPFVSISKYGRKAKINLIWSCIIFHLFVYTVMLVIFYVFPTELTNLNFSEVLSNSFNQNIGSNGAHISGGDVISSSTTSNNNNRHMSVQQQMHYHHHSDDKIVKSSLSGTNKMGHFLQTQPQSLQPSTFYYRSYHANRVISNKNLDNNNFNKNLTNYLIKNQQIYFNSTKPDIDYSNVGKLNKNNNYNNIYNNINNESHNIICYNFNGDGNRNMKNPLRRIATFKNNEDNNNNIVSYSNNSDNRESKNINSNGGGGSGNNISNRSYIETQHKSTSNTNGNNKIQQKLKSKHPSELQAVNMPDEEALYMVEADTENKAEVTEHARIEGIGDTNSHQQGQQPLASLH